MWCLRHIPSITISTSSMRSCILHSTEPSGLYFSFSSLGSKDIYVMCIYRWVLQLSTVKKINNYGFTLNEGTVWHNIFCQHSHLRTYIIYIYIALQESRPTAISLMQNRGHEAPLSTSVQEIQADVCGNSH